jgi:pimeloyl-ACP methyl ester carboxylesterase
VRCAGTLTLPDATGPHPVVVLAHGFALPRDAGLPVVAAALAKAGLASLAFDYRYLGESEGQPRELIAIGRQQADLRAALAHARTLAQLDISRVALWGYSYGGAHVIHLAARDHAIAAVVARVPFVDGLAKTLTFPPARLAALVRTGIVDQLRGVLRRPPAYHRLLGAPGSPALYSDPVEVTGYAALAHTSARWHDRYAPRANLAVPTYRATRQARRVRCPLLVIAGEHDTIALPGTLARLARRAPDATLLRYPADHFSVWQGALGEQVLAAEVAWLTRQLATPQHQSG